MSATSAGSCAARSSHRTSWRQSSKAASRRSSPSRNCVLAHRFSGLSNANGLASPERRCNAWPLPLVRSVQTGPAKRRLEKIPLETPMERTSRAGERVRRGQAGAKAFDNSGDSPECGERIPELQTLWRRERDSNPRYGFRPYTRFPGVHLQPLGHLSTGAVLQGSAKAAEDTPRRGLRQPRARQ